jgi:hypothetical protein
VPSLWVSHRPSYEAAARVPRVEALEAILAKGTASPVVPRKRWHVLLDDVALDRKDLVVAQAIGDAEIRAREVELVQLDGREHFRGACVVAHNRKLLQNAEVLHRKFRSRRRSFHLRDLRSKLRDDGAMAQEELPDVRSHERGILVALHADFVLLENDLHRSRERTSLGRLLGAPYIRPSLLRFFTFHGGPRNKHSRPG